MLVSIEGLTVLGCFAGQLGHIIEDVFRFRVVTRQAQGRHNVSLGLVLGRSVDFLSGPRRGFGGLSIGHRGLGETLSGLRKSTMKPSVRLALGEQALKYHQASND